MLSDKTTAVCAISNMGSCKSLLSNQEKRRIWSWATQRCIFITVAHIPGILNVEAEKQPRKSDQRTKWQLHASIIGYIKNFYPSFFATRINAHLPRFFVY